MIFIDLFTRSYDQPWAIILNQKEEQPNISKSNKKAAGKCWAFYIIIRKKKNTDKKKVMFLLSISQRAALRAPLTKIFELDIEVDA